MLWQHFLSRTLVPVHPAATAVLGLSVWLVYTADRLLDTHLPPGGPESPRHQVARLYRRPFLLAGIPILIADLSLALLFLPLAHFVAGLLLVAAVAARFWTVIHPPARPWPKELWTALIFAAGVWTPILLSNPLRPGAILFVLLCWWNCLAIEHWEAQLFSPPLAAKAMILIVAAGGFYLWSHRPVALAEALTASGFCLLALIAPRLPGNILRVAVDCCLLSPLLFYAS